MHHIDIPEENFPDEKVEKPGRSTGPTSPEGKARSSMNRLTHGCRSEKTVLPHEDRAEYEFTAQTWLNAYNPQDPIAQNLVEETIKAHWFFKRNQTYLDQIASRLPMDAWLWTDEHQRLYTNFTRYKTTAERSFYRAFNALEAHCKRQADRAAQAEKARALMAKANLEWAKKKAQAAAKDLTSVQKVDVVMSDRGDCVTTCIPTNEQMISRAADAAEPPKFVTRYVLFNFGVPAAYDWTNPNHLQRQDATVGIQHFLYSDWLKQIEAEQRANTGHLVPSHTTLLHDPD